MPPIRIRVRTMVRVRVRVRVYGQIVVPLLLQLLVGPEF